MKPPKVIHVVTGSNGQTVSVGKLQIEWLLKEGVARPSGDEHPNWNMYESDMTHMEVHELVWAQPALRECDFCRLAPAPWEVDCMPFQAAAGPLGGKARPVVCCDTCVEMVRSNRKEALMDRAMTSAFKAAKLEGGYLGLVVRTNTDRDLRAHLRPHMRQTVYGMFANRRGFPRRAEFPNEQTGVTE